MKKAMLVFLFVFGCSTAPKYQVPRGCHVVHNTEPCQSGFNERALFGDSKVCCK